MNENQNAYHKYLNEEILKVKGYIDKDKARLTFLETLKRIEKEKVKQ